MSVGPVGALPTDRVVVVGDGSAVVVRSGDGVQSFANRCPHADAELTGGVVRDGVLMCPAHFWRYELPSGRVIGGAACLERFDVTIEGDEAWIEVPDSPVRQPIGELLRDHARAWTRERHDG